MDFQTVAKVVVTKRKCDQCKNIRLIPSNRKKCGGCRRLNQRVNTGEVLAPDTKTETHIDSYKQPMQKAEDGFGYYGAITTTKDDEFVQCHICGYFYKALGVHIIQYHGKSANDYRQEFGLRLKESLLSPAERKRAQDRYNKTARENIDNLKKAWEARKKKTDSGELKLGGETWSAQTRNEKGKCKAQTLAKIVHIARMNDGVPIYTDLAREYGHGEIYTVRYWFGSWENAVKAAGFKTFAETRSERREREKEKALSTMIEFYERENRTPQSSDLDGIEGLPNSHRVTALFGTLNNARQEAGIPQLLYMGWKKGWIEVQPGEQADGFVPSSAKGTA